MTPWRVAGLAALLAGVATAGWALAAGAAGALGAAGGAAVALGAFGWSAVRLGGATRPPDGSASPTPRAGTSFVLALAGMRWTLACFLLWGLLGRADPVAVVTGLGCIPVAIWLLSLFALLRAPRTP